MGREGGDATEEEACGPAVLSAAVVDGVLFELVAKWVRSGDAEMKDDVVLAVSGRRKESRSGLRKGVYGA